ncbi:TPA: ESPR-type extended signal peptide-containing protein [Stenotrophomonas maltophilia]
MNKIYRRLWSTARQCWVVASELASPRGKVSRLMRPASATSLLVLVATLSAAGAANATIFMGCTKENGLTTCFPFIGHDGAFKPADASLSSSYFMVMGNGAYNNGSYSVVFGHQSRSDGDRNAVFGYGAAAKKGYGMAMGTYALTDGIGAMAIGHGSRSYSTNSIALGSNARTHDSTGGISRIAIGGNAFAGSAGWSGAIALGGDSRAEYDSISVGFEARATGDSGAAIGRGAQSTSDGALALGGAARASGLASIAMGESAVAAGKQSLALGDKAKADAYSSFAFGAGAHSMAEGGIAMGYQAKVTNVDAKLSVAIGEKAAVGHARSVALGSHSTTTGTDQVSVGNASTKRKIVNVGDATLAANSYDAVTGRQLFATNQTVASVKTTADSALAKANQATDLISQTASNGQVRVGANNTGTVIDVKNKSGAKRRIQNLDNGVLSTSSTDAVTGQQLHATNQAVATATATANTARTAAEAATARLNAQAPAVGQGASAEGAGATAGAALGYGAKSYNANGLALGADARAGVKADGSKDTSTGAVALGAGTRSGNGAVATGLRAAAVGDRAVALGNDAGASGIHAVALGYKASAAANQATAVGREARATGTYASALGNLAAATAESSVALGERSTASHTGSVALGSGSQTTAADQVSVGNATKRRKIVNVADGTLNAASTEAVTGKQLNATNVEVSAVRTAATAAKTTADSALARARATGNVLSTAAEVSDADKATASGDYAMAMGGKARANGLATMALGNNGDAVGTNAIAIGSATAATAKYAVALGGNAKATHENAVALGEGSVTGGTAQVSVGNATLQRKLVNVADGTLSSTSTDAVTGKQVYATNQKVTANETLLGNHATQLTSQGTRIADNRRDLDALRTDFDNFDPDLEGVVRFEADGAVDMDGGKVRGVAAGDISSAASTDAVNGGQLFATNQKLEAMEKDRGFIDVDWDEYSLGARAGWLGVAIGSDALAEGSGATAVGAYSQAGAVNSVAIGRGAGVLASADYGFALGSGSEVATAHGVAVGSAAQVLLGADNAVALGAASIARDSHTLSVGNDTLKRRIVNVARGVDGHDVVTVSQVDEVLAALGGGAGLDGTGTVIAPNYSVQGEIFNTVGDALSSLDGAVITTGTRVDQVENQLLSVFQDSPSARSDGLGQLNLAGANGMVLSNLADGLVAAGSRDAVTGNQLFDAKQDIARNRGDLNELLDVRDGVTSRGRMLAEMGSVIDFGGAKLTGVDDGVVSEDSRDVISGRQLFRFSESIREIEHHGRFFKIGTDEWSEDASAGLIGVAIGESADASPTGEGGVAVGAYAKAFGINSVALGRASHVSESAKYGQAFGTDSHALAEFGLSYGAWSRVRQGANRSVALGAYSVAEEADTVSVGSDSLKRRIVNVANGRNASDAATVGQLRGALATLGSDVDANGNIVGPTFNVQGGAQHTLGDALNALDGAVTTTGTRVDKVENQLRSVFQESPATRSDGLGQLNLAGANGMVLGNVANGLIAPGSRDAINGGQLHAMEQRLDGRIDGLEQRVDATPEAGGPTSASGEPAAVTAGRAGGGIASADGGGTPAPADAPAPTPQVNTADLEKMLARANDYTDGAISNFERRLDKMDKRFNRMAAMSSAQTAMAMNTAGLATYNRLGAGVGYSDGESAMAVGYQRVLNDKGSATFSLNGAFTNSGERSMGVGVGIGW